MNNKLLNRLGIGIISLLLTISSHARLVIAIDAGHGGRDPGAIGKSLGTKEKDVTLSIAKELKALLDADPNFKGVLTRSGDYFIQLPERTEIARKNQANYLISIHADSSPSSANLKGASVWVLSNRRANDELGKWLEDHEKQSELLGGAGSVLANNNERYLNQTVLDLQFSHSQRTGYELGKMVLSRIKNVSPLMKSTPQHASLSVLRSPDIPSILVETGFLSNADEEKKLTTLAYRKQIARAIYNGLVAYRKNVPSYAINTNNTTASKATKSSNSNSKTAGNTKTQSNTKTQQAKAAQTKSSTNDKETSKVINSNASTHTVQLNETLYSIARMYKTTPEKLSELNGIKNNRIIVGQKLKLK